MLARAWLWRQDVVRVQKIRVPDRGRLSWIVIDREHVPVGVVNEYLVYLHRLGRTPNTVRAYAHHLQAYWAFLVEHKHDWRDLKLTQLAELVSWVRHATPACGTHRSDATTMQDKLSEHLKGTLIDVTGKAVPEDGMNDSADLQWFTRSVLAQALTNGYCAIPIVAGPCPHPNACLNCAHFRTDVTFLEVHRAELHETERVIAKADANGWVRQSEMNERKRTSLINIVTTLEASHG